jgi:hypothetical protein
MIKPPRRTESCAMLPLSDRPGMRMRIDAENKHSSDMHQRLLSQAAAAVSRTVSMHQCTSILVHPDNVFILARRKSKYSTICL